MKNYLISIAVLFILLLNSCVNGQTKNTNLSAADFDTKIKATPFAEIIDVRTPEEFSKGHLINAKNIDWNGDKFDAEISYIDKSKPVFVYCLSGGRSSSAATKMREDGFKEVYELSGGIMKWRGANMPETKESTKTNPGMSKAQFDQLLVADKTVLIDFYADWCAPCKKMKPYLEEISNEMSATVVVIRINADNNQSLCKELRIDGLPALQVYKNKNLTWSNTGFIEKKDIVAHLNP